VGIKRVALILLLTGRLAAPALHAQGAVFSLRGSISLDSLVNLVQHQSSYRIAIDAGKIDGLTMVHFKGGAYSVQSLLREVRQATGLSGMVYGHHIIFQKRPIRTAHSAASPAHSAASPGRRASLSYRRASGSSLPLQKDTSLPELASLPAPSSQKPVPIRPRRVVPRRAPIPFSQQAASSRGSGGDDERLADRYVQLGAAGAEALYLTAGVEVAYSHIFLDLGWATNFGRTEAPRVGLGAILHGGDHTEWQLGAAFCPIRKKLWLDTSAYDHYTVVGQLYEISFRWCDALTRHWMIKAGLTANVLETHYERSGSDFYGGGNLPNNTTDMTVQGNPDKLLGLMDFPYLLFNTYKETTGSNLKGWIGVSAGVYYTFPF
jgi:hypothetical protein